MEKSYIYPIKSSFVDFKDGTCSVSCFYADKSFEVKQYSAKDLVEIEVDYNCHCALFSANYVSYAFISAGISKCDLDAIVEFASLNKVVLVVDERGCD